MSDPLTVRVNDGTTDRHVTKYVSGLGFTKVASGGHQGMKFRLNLPRRVFNDLGPADRAWVYDARTGRTIFGAAYLENPTPVDGASGQAFDISAVGGMALANDETRALVYVTRDLGEFEKAVNSANAADIDTGPWVLDPAYPDIFTGYERVRTAFGSGSLVATGEIASAGNYVFDRSDMNLGGVRVGNVYSGKSDGGWAEEFVTDSGVVASRATSTMGTFIENFAGDPGFPTGVRRFAFRLRRVGSATNVADDLTWTNFVDYSAVGQRVNRFGLLLTGSSLASASVVRADQVVEDLLGRLMPFCDRVTARVDPGTFNIDQLAYTDGVKAAAVLADLLEYETDYWWGIHESDENTGLHRFGFQKWSDEPRYVVSTEDGYRQSGSDVDLCNRILVSWSDANGKAQSTEVTAASLGLVGIGLPVDALGSRIKDADPISLPDGRGSYANAVQVGGAILRDKINPPTAATVTVQRPIVDHLTGNLVNPWELEPGWPVMVREIGNQMRCTEVDYDHASRSAVLTLGTPVLTESQRIVRLSAA